MQREQLSLESTQIRQLPGATFHCNLCSRTSSTSHGRNIHLSSCRTRHSNAESALQGMLEHEQPQDSGNIDTGNRPTPTQLKTWGDYTKDNIHQVIHSIYEKIVYWRRNVFKLPSGAAGKKFVAETTKWIEFWNPAMQPIAKTLL